MLHYHGVWIEAEECRPRSERRCSELMTPWFMTSIVGGQPICGMCNTGQVPVPGSRS